MDVVGCKNYPCAMGTVGAAVVVGRWFYIDDNRIDLVRGHRSSISSRRILRGWHYRDQPAEVSTPQDSEKMMIAVRPKY
ncbi:hypothetical protein BDQ94DRAFT_154881 [Aspergillus welwitschiae]|uniref:Uncharacterized protein n=1 Tax=Aspergillus welwitschiae TaxID=1341132 RepID=A0A3F3PJ00_9EURO|nr:hypothetical protein BDQ94DRAFT_154881 [Aspergillus welwitschiae]RDH26868.1 hypothetical protein BDQ94DRAFT_154881 [Aspergillus welwitschiae]